MASEWLVSALVSSLKRRGLIPTTDEPFAEADYLALANEELRGFILPLLRDVHEEYLWTRTTVSLVAGTSRYRLPERCAAEVLKAVHLVNGEAEPPLLSRVEPENAYRLALSGSPQAYYLEDDALVVLPTPGTGSLLLRYLFRPGTLVSSTSAGEVTSFNAGAKQVTFRYASGSAGVPSGFASGVRYDLIRGVPGFRPRAIDMTGTLASNVLTFTEALPSDLAAGDFVALAGQSPVPQVPAELHPLLAERVAYIAARALSSKRGEEMRPELERMEARVRGLFAQRTEAQPRFVQNFYAPGWRRMRGASRWRRP